MVVIDKFVAQGSGEWLYRKFKVNNLCDILVLGNWKLPQIY